MKNKNQAYSKVALTFASALVSGNYEQAHTLISQSRKNEWSASWLQAEYEEMIAYGDGPPNFVEVMETMEDWPARQEEDIGWAYVAIAGNEYSEAVAVIICNESGCMRIRDIEWGRP